MWRCWVFLLVVGSTALRPGDTVVLISPASPPCFHWNCSGGTSSYRAHAAKQLATVGLNVLYGDNAFAHWGYLAGTDEQRAQDVMRGYSDTRVKAIVANRGGWGCNRLFGSDLLDFGVIAQNAKPLVGYSDLTGCLNALYSIIQKPSMFYHGPMAIDTWSSYQSNWFRAAVMMQTRPLVLYNDDPLYSNSTYTITGGQAKGKLVGGNLSVLVGLAGSKFLPASYFDGAILFLEDVGEAPHAIDRMLNTLRLAGYFSRLSGVVFGICTGCSFGGAPDRSFTVKQVLQLDLQSLGIPVYAGALIGHGLRTQWTLPLGATAQLDADHHTLTLM